MDVGNQHEMLLETLGHLLTTLELCRNARVRPSLSQDVSRSAYPIVCNVLGAISRANVLTRYARGLPDLAARKPAKARGVFVQEAPFRGSGNALGR